MRVYRINEGPKNSTYIGRGSPWGNPFVIGRDGDRNTVIQKFRLYAIKRLKREPNWLEPLRDKEGLVCFCYPLPCHGDVIIELLEKSGPQNSVKQA
jgi:hypothetical protein